jgi:hypothetical protein
MSEKDCGKVVESLKDREKKSTDALCLDYVMKYSLAEIRSSSGDVDMNQLCSEYIQNKEAFLEYVENKRKITGRSRDGDGVEDGNGGGNGEDGKGNKN